MTNLFWRQDIAFRQERSEATKLLNKSLVGDSALNTDIFFFHSGPPKRIHAGEIYLAHPGGTRKTLVAVAETFVHPGYKKPSAYNDIGLLRLAKKLNLTSYVRPACLPQFEHRPHQITSFEATGWGQLDNGGKFTHLYTTIEKRAARADSYSASYFQTVSQIFCRQWDWKGTKHVMHFTWINPTSIGGKF